MCFLKKIFAKQEVKTQNETKPKNEERVENQEKIQATVEMFYERLKNTSQKPITYFTLEKDKPALFDCKIGGAYYIPEHETLPIDQIEKSPLYLLAQINFSQFKAPEGFPTSGLLQIFISGDDDLYGCDFDDPRSQKRWAIRYYESIPNQPVSNRIFQPKAHKETMLPFPLDCEYRLQPHEHFQTITINDYRFKDYFTQSCQDLLKEDQHTIFDLDDVIYDNLCDRLETFASQIGGYPCFTQYDPREYMKDNPCDILLFQLDTVEDIMWGDSGVANFFISEQDLKNKDFTNVVYNWDCM